MSRITNFQKGDRVVRTGGSSAGVKQGGVYTVNYQTDNTLCLEGLIGGYIADLFELEARVRPAPIKPEGAYNPNIGHTTDGGGLQQHSIGGPFPFVVVGIENPKGLRPGTYWYVQDKTGRRVTAHRRNYNMIGNIAAGLVSLYPDGICPDATPDLSASDGWIDRIVKIELTREAASVLQLMCAHTAGPIVVDILRELSLALGTKYYGAQEKFDVSFITCGSEKFEDGWHKGRNQRGSMAITRKGAV